MKVGNNNIIDGDAYLPSISNCSESVSKRACNGSPPTNNEYVGSNVPSKNITEYVRATASFLLAISFDKTYDIKIRCKLRLVKFLIFLHFALLCTENCTNYT